MGWVAGLSVGSKISDCTRAAGVAQGLCASAVLAFSQARRKDRLGHTCLVRTCHLCMCIPPCPSRVAMRGATSGVNKAPALVTAQRPLAPAYPRERA